jgi:hypothetical protein
VQRGSRGVYFENSMKLNPQFRVWLKCVGIFVVIGAIAWWIWNNPMFAATIQEPGPFIDYQPEILGTLVFLYFFPAILAVAFDSSLNPFSAVLSELDPSLASLSVLGFLTATILLPMIYGSIVYGIYRAARFVRDAIRKS